MASNWAGAWRDAHGLQHVSTPPPAYTFATTVLAASPARRRTSALEHTQSLRSWHRPEQASQWTGLKSNWAIRHCRQGPSQEDPSLLPRWSMLYFLQPIRQLAS